jgi:hypothetical protein
MEHSFNDKLKRPRIVLDWGDRAFWNKRRTALGLIFLGILFIGALMFASSKFGTEAEQVQAVDALITD